MSKISALFTFTATLVMTLAAATAHATPILAPVAVTASVPDYSSGFAIGNLINQSGLSASYTSGVTDFASFVASAKLTASPSSSGGWASTTNNQFPVSINFDLGGLKSVSRLALWNDTDSQALGSFQVFSSADATYANLTSLGAFVGATQQIGSLAQVFNFTDATTRYIRISGSPVVNVNGLLNIGEIAFEGSTAVPEPTSIALLGLGLAGFAVTRRRKT